MIAVVFALTEESSEFRRRIERSRLAEQVKVTHSGVGPAAAAQHIGRVLAECPELIIAAGFAGGLDPALRSGAIVMATNHSSHDLIARATGAVAGVFAHADVPVETVAAKAALARATGAIAVDMESQPVADACVRAGVPLLIVRVISDPADKPLPVPFAEWFDLARQRPRPIRLVTWLVRHPSRIVPFARFIRGLRPARWALATFLLGSIEREVRLLGK